MELGKKIIKIREDNNLTQEELAEKYYVTRQTISNWENGKTYPDLETIVKISNDFNVSLDILLKEDEKMVKKIDKSVKSTKKYKNILKYVLVSVCILLFFGFKAIMVNKYTWDVDVRDINKDGIFNDTILINKVDYNGNRINIDEMSIANYFDGYVDSGTGYGFNVKRNDKDEVIGFYTTTSLDQYIYLLSEESISLGMDKENELTETSDSMRSFLNSHEIKDDIDLLKYIKENYYFRNTVFTLISHMKRNHILNLFVSYTLPEFDTITLLSGDLHGYITTFKNGGKYPIKEIHILNNNKQYIMTISGEEISTNEFITKLLQTVKFN